MKAFYLVLLCSLCLCQDSWSQTAEIKGIILDENNLPIALATVKPSPGIGTQSDDSGFFQLTLPALQEIEIVISHLSYRKYVFRIVLQPGESFEYNPVLKTEVAQISEVVLTSENREAVLGLSSIDPDHLRNLPGANAGVENLLKTLPGVSANNELSTQYSVRGGNYDENLVYINEIEVYRPFLIRSGQQEGLSIINPQLVRNVKFSAGGFQANYGDKLSSVLDISYRRPVDFGIQAEMSLLGGSASLETASSNQRFSAIAGIRYRNNSLLVKAKETETNYHPSFLDAQTYLTYRVSRKLELEFLGSISENTYNYEPLTRQTNFGTLGAPLALVVHYQGKEEDRYRTILGALKASVAVNSDFTAKLIASAYNSREKEYFDILAQYRLGQVNTSLGSNSFGEVLFAQSIGSQLTHARNDLDALIVNLEHLGTYQKGKHQVDYGIKFTIEDVRDRLREYEMIDSAGFSLRPPLADFTNNEPYEPYQADLLPFSNIRAENSTQTQRYSGFLQWNKRGNWNNHEIWFSLGVRNHTWHTSGENIASTTHSVVSPRGQFALKPSWKKDMLFRISAGWYHQPPSYRELRDLQGIVRPEVNAQQSIHLVLANEYSFRLVQRPFKLISEIYYKDLANVNAYTLENVRIRYQANNNAEAYAYGLDLRLNGEFVPGVESWLSFGFLKAEENWANNGFIARPTDQRLKFGLFFQDYVPEIPSLKVYLTMIYNTGLPGGSPNYADPYLYQSRLPDYKRADVGFAYVLKDEKQQAFSSTWLKAFEELQLGLEIFNLFNTQNSITNTFVRDVASKRQYAVPNYLTPRVFNLKLGFRF